MDELALWTDSLNTNRRHNALKSRAGLTRDRFSLKSQNPLYYRVVPRCLIPPTDLLYNESVGGESTTHVFTYPDDGLRHRIPRACCTITPRLVAYKLYRLSRWWPSTKGQPVQLVRILEFGSKSSVSEDLEYDKRTCNIAIGCSEPHITYCVHIWMLSSLFVFGKNFYLVTCPAKRYQPNLDTRMVNKLALSNDFNEISNGDDYRIRTQMIALTDRSIDQSMSLRHNQLAWRYRRSSHSRCHHCHNLLLLEIDRKQIVRNKRPVTVNDDGLLILNGNSLHKIW